MTPPDRAAVVERALVQRRRAAGACWPALAAAVLLARARLHADPATFARLLGVPLPVALDLEEGRCAPLLAPPSLSSIAPEVDWSALGVRARERPPPDDPATRHPSARQPWRVVL